jgi:REP element-mobilizing transposase RayT
MKDDRAQYHRRSLRLRGYDYGMPNWYFVTACIQHRAPLFGEVVNDTVCLTPAGEMVAALWEQIPDRFPHAALDLSVVMPDHVHGIIAIEHTGPAEGVSRHASLSGILQWFKTNTTTTYIRGVKTSGWPRFEGRLWQRTFYDHIIRDDRDLDRIRTYILDNPVQWSMDEEANRGP